METEHAAILVVVVLERTVRATQCARRFKKARCARELSSAARGGGAVHKAVRADKAAARDEVAIFVYAGVVVATANSAIRCRGRRAATVALGLHRKDRNARSRVALGVFVVAIALVVEDRRAERTAESAERGLPEVVVHDNPPRALSLGARVDNLSEPHPLCVQCAVIMCEDRSAQVLACVEVVPLDVPCC